MPIDLNQSKESLEEQMKKKNLNHLNSQGALGDLLIYNLENFAYRYIETEIHRDIKCNYDKNNYWVESIEPDILKALKWTNPEIKRELIKFSKKHPGKESKRIKVKLSLGTKVKNEKEVECYSVVSWNYPHFEKSDNELGKVITFQYEDLLDLRNNHASLLEEVASIF